MCDDNILVMQFIELGPNEWDTYLVPRQMWQMWVTGWGAKALHM